VALCQTFGDRDAGLAGVTDSVDRILQRGADTAAPPAGVRSCVSSFAGVAQEPAGQGDPVHSEPEGGAGAVPPRWKVRDRYGSFGERDPAELCGHEELALHRPLGCRLAECGDLQPSNHCAPVSVGPGGFAVQCTASDPDLHPGQPARVATLELEVEGCLTVGVDSGAVWFGCPRQIRNHSAPTPAWEPWGSAYGYG
jgi:hypothetical protein